MKFFEQLQWGNKLKTKTLDFSKVSVPLSEIKQSNHPRFLENIQKLFKYFFGQSESPGAIAQFTTEYTNYKPFEWAVERQRMLKMIDPTSVLFQQITKDRDSRVILNNSYFPNFIQNVKIQQITRQLQLKKTYRGFSVPLLDGYFFMLMKAIYDSDYQIIEYSEYEYLTLDDIYSSISRNALLILLWRVLNHFGHHKHYLQKIFDAFRIYFIDEMVIKYQENKIPENIAKRNNLYEFNINGKPDNTNNQIKNQAGFKYKLKSNHLQALMIFIKFNNYVDIGKYFLSVSKNFKEIASDKHCLHNLIRTWIYYADMNNNVEDEMIKTLQKANAVDGWFDLKRYSPQRIHGFKSVSSMNMTIARSILQNIGIESLWKPSTMFLYTLACFFNFLNNSQVYFTNVDSSQKISNNFQGQNIEYKAIKKCITQFNNYKMKILGLIKRNNPKQLMNAYEMIQRHENLIQNYAQKFFKCYRQSQNPRTSVTNDFQISADLKFIKIHYSQIKSPKQQFAASDKIISGESTLSNTSLEQKNNLISFYRNQPRGCWQIPIQSNQSIFLFYIFFAMAKMIDIIIPGFKQRNSPKLNIRFLANPMIFGSILVILFIMYFLL